MSFNESNTVEQMILDAVEPCRNSQPEYMHCGFLTINLPESGK
jgi:hypothetical protein